jgi:hypothetical protein
MDALISVNHSHPLIVAKAPLPVSYTAAQQALNKCYAIDECKAWADKAAALESYARQSDDQTLLNLAKRIKGRAIRRCGELLREIEAANGARTDLGTVRTRSGSASHAGLSERQRKQALRIANIPLESFEQQIEADIPPTLTELAAQGTNKKPLPLFDLEGIDPEDFQVATRVMGAVSAIATLARTTDPGQAVRGMKPQEKHKCCADLAVAQAWLDKLWQEMKCIPTAT